MPLTDPTDIPSLDRVFGRNKNAMKAFAKVNITSVVPVMLLPRQVLVEFGGIGERTATYIIDTLAQNGLGSHRLDERMTSFIVKQFGCLDDAPISVLNVICLRGGVATRPYYAPLHLLELVEKVNPHFTLGDLLNTSTSHLVAMVDEQVSSASVLDDVKREASDLVWRFTRLYTDDFTARRSAASLVHSQ